ncbi:hypothetical protein FM038_022185 [Shewanella eurypsychrophilus]|uniref:Lipoprotein n=1 Tax=Shewanella eurypsychrophilus TaxID=2593656 RepID=A0ABX6VAU3_9GAMM|nr:MULTISPECIES: hypothetical protein [Shewanella]QFU24578.1 hypothetical protein FS418_23860 [Shewanella sp. YLB-09]QPG59775.1 hypothetical protein FM038_022185 [Shewanella eurypsychrophilus]
MNKLYLTIALLGSPFLTEASCDDRKPIPTIEQKEIINKLIVNRLKHQRYSVNKEFHQRDGTDFFEIEIPELYKDIILDSVNVTYWDSNQIPVVHASLFMGEGFNFKNEVIEEDLPSIPLKGWDRTGSKVVILSVNDRSQLTPSVTLNFGNMCYNHFEMSINNMPELIDKKLQSK